MPVSDFFSARLAGKATLEPVRFEDLPGFELADLRPAARALELSVNLLRDGAPCLRPGVSLPSEIASILITLEFGAAASSWEEARCFFRHHFAVFKIAPADACDAPNRGKAFLTGYYEPEVEGSWTPSPAFSEPILARPWDLITFEDGFAPLGADFRAGRLVEGGRFEPYPTRAAINAGALADRAKTLLWVRDGIEAFMIHVQGSARVMMENGPSVRLTYAGRNGRPYTSIGRILLEEGRVPPEDMTLERLKEWVRAAGQAQDESGRRLMERNESFIFFAANANLAVEDGPIGAQGVSLSALNSIAVDRSLWPYGLPFWISGQIPWERTQPSAFHRLMIAQDTGSAILGPARADLFFGTGATNGILAGQIRHPADMYVLLPKVDA